MLFHIFLNGDTLMFCQQCGAQTSDTAQFCASCGKPTGAAPAMPVAAPSSEQGRVSRNLNVIGALWIVSGALMLIATAWIMFLGHSVFPSFAGDMAYGMSPFPGHFPLGHMISAGLLFAGFWLGVLGVVNVLAGWGLIERQPWARILCIILAFLALLRFPLGTALGIYTLWVLLPAPAGQEYDRLGRI
jgi:hypothetical protein